MRPVGDWLPITLAVGLIVVALAIGLIRQYVSF